MCGEKSESGKSESGKRLAVAAAETSGGQHRPRWRGQWCPGRGRLRHARRLRSHHRFRWEMLVHALNGILRPGKRIEIGEHTSQT